MQRSRRLLRLKPNQPLNPMKLINAFLVIFAVSLISCNPCDEDCENAPSYATCSEKPETNGTTCQAYFETWFYDESTGECAKKGYSGCEPLGFETAEECDKCDCHRLESGDFK